MVRRGAVPWRTLDRWRAKSFLTAGGLFLASPVAKGLVLIADDPLPEVAIAVLACSGLVAALGGLLGLYPELTEQVPRHALAGVVTTMTAGGVTVGVFVWLITARVLEGVPHVAAPGSPPALDFVSLVGVMAIGFATVGTACLRVAAPSRTVGGLLLALAVPWVVILGAGAVYGPDLPVVVSLLSYGAIPVGFLVTGYAIRKSGSVAGRETAAADVTTN